MLFAPIAGDLVWIPNLQLGTPAGLIPRLGGRQTDNEAGPIRDGQTAGREGGRHTRGVRRRRSQVQKTAQSASQSGQFLPAPKRMPLSVVDYGWPRFARQQPRGIGAGTPAGAPATEYASFHGRLNPIRIRRSLYCPQAVIQSHLA